MHHAPPSYALLFGAISYYNIGWTERFAYDYDLRQASYARYSAKHCLATYVVCILFILFIRPYSCHCCHTSICWHGYCCTERRSTSVAAIRYCFRYYFLLVFLLVWPSHLEPRIGGSLVRIHCFLMIKQCGWILRCGVYYAQYMFRCCCIYILSS